MPTGRPGPLKPGQKLRKYLIKEKLGEGGMGIVFKAWDPDIDMPVAIKWMDASYAPDPAAMAQSFKIEAQTYAKLNHSGLVAYRDYIIEKANLYMVTAFVEGEPLDIYTHNHGYMNEPDAARMIIKVLEALDYAHANGVIHRDLKPANIMLKLDGSPVVLDFGISKSGGASAHTMHIAAQAYSPFYAAPEQVAMLGSGIHTSPASDIYSIGVVLAQVVAGLVDKQVIPENSAQRLIRDSLTSLPGLTPQLELIVMRAIRPHSDQRYQSARDMIEALLPIAGASNMSAINPVFPPGGSPPSAGDMDIDSLRAAARNTTTLGGRSDHDIRLRKK